MKRLVTMLIILSISGICLAELPDPVIYLPFDGDVYPDSWNNFGTAGPDTISSLTTFNDIHPELAPTLGVRGGCLDLRHATMGGTAGVVRYGYPYATNDTPMEVALDNVKSFTITGWFNTASEGLQVGSGARLFNRINWNNPGGGNAIMLYAIYGGKLTLWVDDGFVHAPAYQYGGTNKWVYFAVSYDGTKTADNVNFYVGLADSAEPNDVQLVGGTAVTLDQGTVDQGYNHPMVVCNAGYTETSAVYSYSGLFDEFRIYASKTDDSGALSLEQVKDDKMLAFTSYCGDSEHPFPAGDFNYDCVVDLLDYRRFIENWLTDNRP